MMSFRRCIGRLQSASALIGLILLSACYATQVPVVTHRNAHPGPVIRDGEYCEVIFGDSETASAILSGRCIALNWVPEAVGWRTDNPLLGSDEHGISIRARKLSNGPDALGQSGFFMIQAGAQPQQVVMGGRTVSTGAANLVVILPGDDVFAVVSPRLPQEQAASRARTHKINLSAEARGATIASLGVMTSEVGDIVGAWLAHEVVHEVRNGPAPGPSPEQNTIRIFIRKDAASLAGWGASTVRARAMVNTVVRQAEELGRGLGLAPSPAFSPAPIVTPSAPVARPVPLPPLSPRSPAPQQPVYNMIRHCIGMLAAVRLDAMKLGAAARSARSHAARSGDRQLAHNFGVIGDDADATGDVAGKMIDSFTEVTTQMERTGNVDVASGQRYLEQGRQATQQSVNEPPSSGFDEMKRASDRIYAAFEQGADCLERVDSLLPE